MKWKLFIIYLVFLLCLVPKVIVNAEEETVQPDRTRHIPKVISSEVKFNLKQSFDWFGLVDVPKENIIEEFVLVHQKAEELDYSLYYLVCDFELKTKTEDGFIATTNFQHKIDFDSYEESFLDNVLVFFKLKDDFYEHVFNYRELLEHAEFFEAQEVNTKGDCIYNTVLSQADFYYVRKSDNAEGQKRRYTFTWDENFWSQTCKKIEFAWVAIEAETGEEIVKVIGTNESETGVEGYSSNADSYLGIEEETLLSQLSKYVVAIPTAVVTFMSKLGGFIKVLSDLFKVVFPFIPSVIIDAFFAFMCFGIVVAIWNLVKGLFL